MSGPIVRKYGFPNFEKIFGEREIKHGAGSEAPATGPPASSGTETRSEDRKPQAEPPKKS